MEEAGVPEKVAREKLLKTGSVRKAVQEIKKK